MTTANDLIKHMLNPMRTEDDALAVLDYLKERSAEAESVVLKRMPEADLVKLLFSIQAACVSAMIAKGDGLGLIGEMDSLQGYTNSVTLAVLGIAMDEEWM